MKKIFTILIVVFAFTVKAQIVSNAEQRSNERSLNEVLNLDGTLKPNSNGSFNATGFTITYGKNGEPVFLPTASTQSDDDLWDGVSSNFLPSVNALAVSGINIYVGAGDNIYHWNGTQWQVLGGGLGNGINSPAVYAIAVSGNGDVYVGGGFTTAGGVSASNIAKWNGSTWSALGSGITGSVNAIAISGNEVYVAGTFTKAGGQTVSNIAKWNGSTNTWSALGLGLSGGVNAIATSGSDVYVVGGFNKAGGNPANFIAKWNGSSWSALGSGVDGGSWSANAIAISGSDVYVGGGFATAGGQTASRIAKWNITTGTWSALGSGIDDCCGSVNAIAVLGNEVYVAGRFTKADGQTAMNTAKWNSSTNTWSVLGSGVGSNNNGVSAIAISGNEVYAAGSLSTVGGNIANRIAKWDGSTWSIPFATFGSGVNNYVNTVAVSGSDVYVGGNFTAAGDVTGTVGIAKWNGSTWSALGSGVAGGYIYAIAISGSDVYVGGGFTMAGGNSNIKYLAKWNSSTSTWSALGSGLGGGVSAIAVLGSDVYVGGNFTMAGGDSNIKCIAKWDGSTWSSLGSGVAHPHYGSSVNAITISGSDVYVGGTFATAGGQTVNNIAKWNGSTWSALGSGVGESVNAIAISGSNVYVGGGFTTAGGQTANRIAKWNITTGTWSALGSGVTNNRINRESNLVKAIAISGNGVYVGGYFGTAGNKVANHFALYHTPITTPVNLLSFTAALKNNGVQLAWATATESNNSHFVVERSTNGQYFTLLAKVIAKSENGANYAYIDNLPTNGTNYYRLTQIDNDGKATVLGVRTVTLNLTPYTLNLYPNPTAGKVQIKGEALQPIVLYNTIGKKMTANVLDANGYAELDMTNFASGVYLLHIGKKEIIKVIKQ